MSQLFRPESLKHQSHHLMGDVMLLRPVSLSLLTMTIVLIVAAVGTLLFYGTYTRKETVTGYLNPDKGLVKVYATYLGIINQQHIVNRQQVTVGETLFSISTDLRVNDHDISLNQQLLKQLALQQKLVEDKIASEDTIFNEESKRLSNLIKHINIEIEQLNVQLKTQTAQVTLAKKEWKKYQRFRKQKLVTEPEVTEREYRYLNLKTELDLSQQAKTNKRNRLVDIKSQQEQLPSRRDIRLKELDNERAAIEQRILELNDRQAYTVKSPISGQITTVLASEGQTVDTAKPLVSIIPQNAELYAELLLPSHAIGFVKIGQPVLMRYDAFPYQRYGLYKGKVAEVSGTVLQPQELSVSNAQITEPVYLVKVKLEQQNILAYGKKLELQSGMQVSADIILDTRSLLEWLLEPLYSLKGRQL